MAECHDMTQRRALSGNTPRECQVIKCTDPPVGHEHFRPRLLCDLRQLVLAIDRRDRTDDDADLKEAGYACSVAELVARRARQAQTAGIDGLILSPHELGAIRTLIGPDMLLVTPGVRPAGADVGDQKRIMTPSQAIAASADHIVVGRPITRAADPRAAAEAIIAEIAGVIH